MSQILIIILLNWKCQTAKNESLSPTPPIPTQACVIKALPPKPPYFSSKTTQNTSNPYRAVNKTSAPASNSTEYHTKTNSPKNVWSITTSSPCTAKTSSNCSAWTVSMGVPSTRTIGSSPAKIQLAASPRIMKTICAYWMKNWRGSSTLMLRCGRIRRLWIRSTIWSSNKFRISSRKSTSCLRKSTRKHDKGLFRHSIGQPTSTIQESRKWVGGRNSSPKPAPLYPNLPTMNRLRSTNI